MTLRSLLYIPVLHSPADMGSLASKAPLPEDYRHLADTYWNVIAVELRASRQAWGLVRVYQDGLPATEPEIVARIVAEVESPNYALLRWLAEEGAEVLGTEDPVLLQEEYELLMAAVADDAQRHAYEERAEPLLDGRDRYIARRIDETLPPGGHGVLFIGMEHGASHLPSDLILSTLPSCEPLLRRARRR